MPGARRSVGAAANGQLAQFLFHVGVEAVQAVAVEGIDQARLARAAMERIANKIHEKKLTGEMDVETAKSMMKRCTRLVPRFALRSLFNLLDEEGVLELIQDWLEWLRAGRTESGTPAQIPEIRLSPGITGFVIT